MRHVKVLELLEKKEQAVTSLLKFGAAAYHEQQQSQGPHGWVHSHITQDMLNVIEHH